MSEATGDRTSKTMRYLWDEAHGAHYAASGPFEQCSEAEVVAASVYDVVVAERDRLTRERDQLLAAIGEHVTVRSDQHAKIERLARELERRLDRDELYQERLQLLSRLQAAAGGYQELGDSMLKALAGRDRLRAALEETLEELQLDDSRHDLMAKIISALSGEPGSGHETFERPFVVYRSCAKHIGIPWTLSAPYTTPPKEVCPICEPPSKASETPDDGWVIEARCAGCGVERESGGHHWSRCSLHPGELVNRPPPKAKGD